jgi:membrane-bound lytic murein transglycosylase D
MPKTAENYGLRLDRWVDERLDPERSTDAGLNFLRDLHARFGRWELALAAYNMGHGGLLSSIRKYNTNDFWELSELEAGVPYETALYVPKILALAFVARNRAVFGCEGVEADAPLPFEVAMVKPGTTLEALAKATGRPRDDLEALNPQLVGGALPPVAEPAGALALRVPPGTKGEAERPLARTPQGELEAVTLRWGESLESIAAARGTTESALRKLNAIGEGPPLRPGARVLAPKSATSSARGESTVAVVPARVAELPGKKRAFYEVAWGDELGEVARVLGVSADELVRWNNLDRGAKLHARMVLQAFVGGAIDPAKVRLLGPEDVRVLTVGTDEFFDHFESKNHRKRVVVTVAEGDTFRGLAKRHGLTLGMLERINHRSREAALVPGERLVVYARRDDVPNVAAKSSPSQAGTTDPAVGTTSAKTLPPSDDAPDAVVDERADDGL